MQSFRPTVLLWLASLLLTPPVMAQAAGGCLVRDPELRGTYEGDCVAGLASGKGRAVGRSRYEGTFRDGNATGFGIYTAPDGSRAEGDFLDGKPNGRAKIYKPDGDVLEGLFSAGHLVGTGRVTRANGDVHSLALRDGKLRAGQQLLNPATSAASLSTQPSSVEGSVGVKWTPRIELDDIFPSFILANATRVSKVTLPPRYLGDPWGSVGIRVVTETPNSTVSVSISIDDLVETAASSYQLEVPGEYVISPKILYRFDKLRSVLEPRPVNIVWSVKVNDQAAEKQIRTVRLRSVFDAPLQLAGSGSPRDLSYVFAAFVTEDAPWIDKLMHEVLVRGNVKAFTGYQSGPRAAINQVEAIYDTLQRRGVKYSSITTSSASQERVASQVVRFPLDSVNNAQANCVDGTVLMASVLRKIGMNPSIVLGPGHAMLSFSNSEDPKDGFTVVETTMIGTKGFREAVNAGAARYADWQVKHRQDGQMKTINIARARDAGIMPIPR